MRKRTPLLERFWKLITKNNKTGCWEWTGYLGRGYGIICEGGFQGKLIPAHRLSWSIHNGQIPKGMFICHRCDNPKCVNPEHLFVGTQKDNMHDASIKGRTARGEMLHTAKLKERDIIKIRKLFANGKRVVEIAQKYDIKVRQIYSIVNKEAWKHVKDSDGQVVENGTKLDGVTHKTVARLCVAA